nr:hypothetical protein [Kibdelosporangium sp. MJ126-NF4]CTQ97530.1 hypothetical protein [Kibdelosporangium sp. MJ126-NF4]
MSSVPRFTAGPPCRARRGQPNSPSFGGISKTVRLRSPAFHGFHRWR